MVVRSFGFDYFTTQTHSGKLRRHMPLRKRKHTSARLSHVYANMSSYGGSTVENTVGVICCCMPIIPGITKPIIQSKFWSTLASQVNRWSPKSSHRGVQYGKEQDNQGTESQEGAHNVSNWSVGSLNQQPWQLRTLRPGIELEPLNGR